MITRKVQSVGYSTLIVSLPKDWADKVGLKRGDRVNFLREEDGSLRLIPEAKMTSKEKDLAIINSDLCEGEKLLTRIITGCYIRGFDTIQVKSKKEFKPYHLTEIRKTANRLTGIGIVEQTMRKVTLQSFVDPTKFPMEGLIRRLHVIALSMQDIAMQALLKGRPELAKEVIRMEEEANRIYWLIIRQLILAMEDLNISKKIGLAFPRNIGNRVIAKCLEEMADYAENIAVETLQIGIWDWSQNKRITNDLSRFHKLVGEISSKAMTALFKGDVRMANETIEMAKKAELEERRLLEHILIDVQYVNIAVGLRSIAWNLRQIAVYSGMIGEITINTAITEPSDLIKFEKIRLK